MSNGYVFVDGQVMPTGEAQVSTFDYGLLYGLAIFETLRAAEGRPLFVEAHTSRMHRGAEALGIPWTYDPKSMDLAMRRTLEANGLRDARVRITLTAGPGTAGPTARPEQPTLMVTAAPLAITSEVDYERGHKAVIATLRRSSLSPVPRLKTTNLIENIFAHRQAQEKGADHAIMLNEKRCLTECSFANIFFVAHGALMTPSLDCGLLPGITRDHVIDLAVRREMRVEQRWIASEEIWDAEEVFVTNSIIGLMPVTSVNGRPIHGGTPGKVTRALTMLYEELVGWEIATSTQS